jgi:Na+/phosphate symporter
MHWENKMTDYDWTLLASDWQAQATNPEILLRAVRKQRRKHVRSLMFEFLGVVVVLGVVGWFFLTQPEQRIAQLRTWHVGTAALVIAWQAGYLWLRRRHNLFAVATSVRAMIQAEINFSRYQIAYLWFGLLGGLILTAWALTVIPPADLPVAKLALRACAAFYLPYIAIKTWWMRRRIRHLQRQEELQD